MHSPTCESIEVSRWRPLVQNPSEPKAQSVEDARKDSLDASDAPNPPNTSSPLSPEEPNQQTAAETSLRPTVTTLALVIEALTANPSGLRSVDIAKWLATHRPDSPLGQDAEKAKLAIQSVLSVQARARRPIFEKWRETRAAAPGYIWTLCEPSADEDVLAAKRSPKPRRQRAISHSSTIAAHHTRVLSNQEVNNAQSSRSVTSNATLGSVPSMQIDNTSLPTPSPSAGHGRIRNNSAVSGPPFERTLVFKYTKGPTIKHEDRIAAIQSPETEQKPSAEGTSHQAAVLTGRQRVEELKASVKDSQQRLEDLTTRLDQCTWQEHNVNAELRSLDQARLRVQEQLDRQRAWRDYLTGEIAACRTLLSGYEDGIWVAEQDIALHWESLHRALSRTNSSRPNTSSGA